MEYLRPRTQKEALLLLKRFKGRATLIAGGTNVIADLRGKAILPEALIDISHLKSLFFIKADRKKIRIGALTTISELASSEMIQKSAALLFHACNQLGNPLVRNRATLAGNIAYASPAADTAVPLLALEADILTNLRRVPIDRFFRGPNETLLQEGEMIKEISFLKPNARSRMGYFKLGLRNAMAISVVSIAIVVEVEKNICKKARVSYGAVAPKPIRAYRIEEMLENKELNEQLVGRCCERVREEINPISDIRASSEYRAEMASVLLGRLINQYAR